MASAAATAASLSRDAAATDKSGTRTITNLSNKWLGPFVSSAVELTNLFPDSILFGSFLLYVITQNLSYGVFSLFLFETSVLHRMAGFVVQQTLGDIQQPEKPCVAGFRDPRLAMERVRSLRPQGLSPFAFFIGAVVTYLCAAIGQFKESLDVMGPDWSGRFYFVVIMAPLIALAMLGMYWWTSCFTLQGGLLAVGAGCLAGGALYLLNKTLFGPEGMNFLGLPYLINKADAGDPIYICSAAPITAPNQ
jgi:hypothetical protein